MGFDFLSLKSLRECWLAETASQKQKWHWTFCITGHRSILDMPAACTCSFRTTPLWLLQWGRSHTKHCSLQPMAVLFCQLQSS